MTQMNWTDQPPTVTGWYWVKNNGVKGVRWLDAKRQHLHFGANYIALDDDSIHYDSILFWPERLEEPAG